MYCGHLCRHWPKFFTLRQVPIPSRRGVHLMHRQNDRWRTTILPWTVVWCGAETGKVTNRGSHLSWTKMAKQNLAEPFCLSPVGPSRLPRHFRCFGPGALPFSAAVGAAAAGNSPGQRIRWAAAGPGPFPLNPFTMKKSVQSLPSLPSLGGFPFCPAGHCASHSIACSCLLTKRSIFSVTCEYGSQHWAISAHIGMHPPAHTAGVFISMKNLRKFHDKAVVRDGWTWKKLLFMSRWKR